MGFCISEVLPLSVGVFLCIFRLL